MQLFVRVSTSIFCPQKASRIFGRKAHSQKHVFFAQLAALKRQAHTTCSRWQVSRMAAGVKVWDTLKPSGVEM